MSAEKILESDHDGTVVPVTLERESEAGVIFLTCAELPELFLAVASPSNLRSAIDRGLKNAFCKEGREVSVYTNGSLSGPQIGAMVRVVSAA
jgi:hypothetical protein